MKLSMKMAALALLMAVACVPAKAQDFIKRNLAWSSSKLEIGGVSSFSTLLQIGRTETGVPLVVFRVPFDTQLETLDQPAGGILLGRKRSDDHQTDQNHRE